MKLLTPLFFAGAILIQAQEFHSVEIGSRSLNYVRQGSFAVIEGDIIVGTTDEVEAAAGGNAAAVEKLRSRTSVAVTNVWTNGIVPYVVDPGLPNPQRVTQAIAHWESNTTLRFAPRSAEPNYVKFILSPTSDCSSFLGMRGGEQVINIPDWCETGSVIHEIGHAAGLGHEQNRSDRNQYVTVLYENIDKRYVFAFEPNTSTVDLGYYDYDSIMHYPPQGFSRKGGQVTVETVPVGIPIGQRIRLSSGDVEQSNRLYGVRPTGTTVTTMPVGRLIVVDGETYTSPQTFPWAEGTSHAISVAPTQGTDPQYRFVRWTDGGDVSHNFVASPDRTIVAATFQVQHRVSVFVSSGNGTVSIRPVSPDGYYPERQPITLEAAPGAGWQFVRWAGNTNFSANYQGQSAQKATIEVGLVNGLYGASFTTQALTSITSDPPGRTVTVDGIRYYTPLNLQLSAGPHSLSLSDLQAEVGGVARYRFQGWSDGSSATTRTLTAGETLNASFVTQYLLTATRAGTGTVQSTPASLDSFYDADSMVTVNASGGILRYWLGDGMGTSNPQVVRMDEQKLIVANFGQTIAFRPLNAGSYQGCRYYATACTDVAPLEIVTLFGTNLGPSDLTVAQADGSGHFPSTLGGTRVLFNGVPAALIYTSETQTSVVVPATVSQSPLTLISVERNGIVTGTLGVGVIASKPSFFTADSTGKGQLAAFNQDGSLNGPDKPASPGSVVVLFGTGGGLFERAVTDGQVADTNLTIPKQPVAVKIGKLPARVGYAGSAPYLIHGVLQVNLEIPNEALPGETPIQVSIGPWTSAAGTTIWVK